MVSQQLEAELLQPIIKYQSMQTPRKPSNDELCETKIKVLKEEQDMKPEAKEEEVFNFGTVVFKTKDVKQEKPSLPSLLTLTSGTDQITSHSFKILRKI